MISLSILAFWFIMYQFVRQKGLLAFMPPGLRKVMLEVSFFDILVNIFIYRKLSKMLIALFKPFISADDPEVVKQTLKEEGKLPESVYRGLFRKVSASRLSTKFCTILGYNEQLFSQYESYNASLESAQGGSRDSQNYIS